MSVHSEHYGENRIVEINGKRFLKYYIHDGYIKNERVEYYEDCNVTPEEQNRIEQYVDTHEVEILINLETGRIEGVNGKLIE